MLPTLQTTHIAVIGLGYVGLPLAVAFGKRLPTVGYDIRAERIAELAAGHDRTCEVEAGALAAAGQLQFTDQLSAIAGCNVYIITVPTPIDAAKRPDLGPLTAASEAVGSLLKAGDVVIYESTVYPGCTEEVCVPILERVSGLACALGEADDRSGTFCCGYSPERINPGDKAHRLPDIKKVTSGSTPAAADFVDRLYAQIITAGTHKASSLKVAEAAKVIENTQRDLNIALVNDLAILFNKLGVDTLEVLEAAGTKWNFLPFRPGLVGGHCIGVDPYYLTHKAQQVGHHPDMILAGRRTNDGMGAYVAEQIVKLMVRKGINPVGARALILGLAFKENCPDLRNTRVVDMVATLKGFNMSVDVHDPCVSADEAYREHGLTLVSQPVPGHYDAVVLAVAHAPFRDAGVEGARLFAREASVVYDIKGVFPPALVDGRL